MRKIIYLLATLALLNGCSFFVNKMDIEQGNVVTPQMMAHIHTGMTESQVKEILGPPVLQNLFDKNRLDYVYSFKPGHGTTQEKSMTLIFKNGRLSEITGNMYSEFINH